MSKLSTTLKSMPLNISIFILLIMTHPTYVIKAFYSWRFSGFKKTKNKISNAIENKKMNLIKNIFKKNIYDLWLVYHSHTKEADNHVKHNIENFNYKPLISIIIPIYNTPLQYLKKALQSVENQLYPLWECILVDDNSSQEFKNQLHKYTTDPRIKTIFLTTHHGISGATNQGLKIAQGEFIAFMDHDDQLSTNALYHVSNVLNKKSTIDILYSDSDHIDKKGKRYNPYFKPDWDPYLILSQNYVSHLFVVRKKLIDKVGNLDPTFDGSQDWDLILRLSEHTDKIFHIPHILYHWRKFEGDDTFANKNQNKCLVAGKKAVEAHLKRRNIKALVTILQNCAFLQIHFALPQTSPLISILIPTKDKLDFLKPAIDSILIKSTYKNYEILIINNNSEELETIEYLNSLSTVKNIRVLNYPHPFNYSMINNFAEKQANGEILVLLNNDVEIITKNWLEEMLSIILQKDVGIVGAKLYYNNNHIQHAGVALGIGGVAGHLYLHEHKEALGYFGKLKLLQSFSAVTGACLMIKRKVYQEVGGLEEENLPIAFNDVDLCIKVKEAGYRILWTPHAELYHKESATRGPEDTSEKQARAEKEALFMLKKWSKLLKSDPYYNPNLSLVGVAAYLPAIPPRNFFLTENTKYMIPLRYLSKIFNLLKKIFY